MSTHNSANTKYVREHVTTASVVVLILALVLAGLLVILIKALPYIRDEYHAKIESVRTEYVEEIGTFLHLKFETTDGFIAGNTHTRPHRIQRHADTRLTDNVCRA